MRFKLIMLSKCYTPSAAPDVAASVAIVCLSRRVANRMGRLRMFSVHFQFLFSLQN